MEVVTVGYDFVAAFTATTPDDASAFDAARNPEHDQTAESLSRDVNEFSGHGKSFPHKGLL